jgi:cytochrome c oxidase assembly factor CtaG/putative copper export protein
VTARAAERPNPVPGRRPARWAYPVAGLAAAAAALVALLHYGGGAARGALPGLPDPGVATAWMLPAVRLAGHAAAVATVGLLLAAVLLSPQDRTADRGSLLSPTGYRRVRAAGWAALAWSVCHALTVVYSLSDLLGRPVGEAVSVSALASFIGDVNIGQAFTFSAVLALVVFVTCRVSLRPLGATVALGLAVLATMPPVFTGHAAAAGDHQLAVSSMLLHAVPVTLWAGGLLALVISGRPRAADLAVAVRRFSPLAATCLVLVAVSGLLSAYVRLSSPTDLVSHPYGRMVLVKVAALLGLAAAGWWQRRAAMPALRRGERRTFTRVATVEIVLFGLAMGAAVALSRSPAPAGEPVEEDLATSMLGYPMPPELTAETLLTRWLPEPLYLTAALVAAGAYLAGVRRLRRRGDRWPVERTASFLGGCAVVVIATNSGLAVYGPVLFSVHMVQHLLMGMIAPILLALGGPVTLALRTLRKATDPAWPGPREWLQSALHLPLTRVLTQPLVALAVYVVSMYAMYLTELYQTALRSHAAHLLMMAHFLLGGYLFFWVVIGVDPAPRRRRHLAVAGQVARAGDALGAGGAAGAALGRLAAPVRLVLVLVSMVLHAFLGIVIMQSGVLLAPEWFTTLPRPWGPDPLEDQYIAGGIAWSFGEVPTLLVACALVVQWIRADEREQRRLDRAADRAEAEGREDEALRAYNAMLAELARRDAVRRSGTDNPVG